jgi:hypothetical protein
LRCPIPVGEGPALEERPELMENKPVSSISVVFLNILFNCAGEARNEFPLIL